MLGHIIKHYLDICGISIADLARGTGIEQARLEAMLEGKEPIMLEDYSSICKYLEVPLSMFTDAIAREKE